MTGAGEFFAGTRCFYNLTFQLYLYAGFKKKHWLRIVPLFCCCDPGPENRYRLGRKRPFDAVDG
jgi:hypothetical protein